jgi:hypothetical protein
VSQTSPAQNKALVLEAFDTLFIFKRFVSLPPGGWRQSRKARAASAPVSGRFRSLP